MFWFIKNERFAEAVSDWNGWVLGVGALVWRAVPCGFASKSGSREGRMYGAVSDRGRAKQARVGSGAGASGLDGYTEVDPNPRGVLRFYGGAATNRRGDLENTGGICRKSEKKVYVKVRAPRLPVPAFRCLRREKVVPKRPAPLGDS